MEEFKLKKADENEIHTLSNPLDEDFTFYWNKVPYTVPAMSTKPFPYFLAFHGGKHLADRILISKGRLEDLVDANGIHKQGSKLPVAGDREAIALWLIDQELEIAQTVVEDVEQGKQIEKKEIPDFTPNEPNKISENPLQ